MANNPSFKFNKTHLVLALISAYSFSNNLAYSEFVCSNSGVCTYPSPADLNQGISITSNNTTLNIADTELNIDGFKGISITGSNSEIQIFENATIKTSGTKSIYIGSSNSIITFHKNVDATSNSRTIFTDFSSAEIVINGNATVTSTATNTTQGAVDATGGKITINGDLTAIAGSGSSNFGAGAYNKGTITVEGTATVSNGSGNNSSALYAGGYSKIILGKVFSENTNTNLSSAGVMAGDGSSITVNGDSTVISLTGKLIGAGTGATVTLKDIYLTNTKDTTNKTQGSTGLDVQDNSSISFDKATITMNGLNASGIHTISSSTVTANDLAIISIKGDNSFGVYSSSIKSAVNFLNGLNLTVEGKDSIGLAAVDGSTIIVKNALNISLIGGHSSSSVQQCIGGTGICLSGDKSNIQAHDGGNIETTGHAITFDSGDSISLALSNQNIKTTSTTDSLIEVNKSTNSEITFNNTTATAGNGGNALLLNVLNGSQLLIEANQTSLYGNIKADAGSTVNLNLKNASYFKGSIDPINLDISSDSKWDITSSSELGNFTNAGITNFIASTSNTAQTLTVDSYSGGGSLGLNTYLNAGVGSSDILEISATGTSSGTNYINILKKDGLGVRPPAIGLQVVQAPTGATQADTFALTGGSVAAGIYEYTLYRNDNGNWYLSAHQTSYNQPSYNGSVSSVVSFASLAQLYNNLSLGTWNERVGDMAYADVQQIQAIRHKASPLWVRMEHERGEHDGGKRFQATDTADMYSPQLKYRTSFLQVGADLLRKPMSNGAYQFAGVSFTVGHIKADVNHLPDGNINAKTNAGAAKIDNHSLGAYLTYLAADRSYIDVVGQYTRHSLDGHGPAGSVSGKGHTLAASVEVGKAFALSTPNWSVIPQAQLRYQDVKLKKIEAKAGSSVVGDYHFGNNDSLNLRLGLEARYQFQRLNKSSNKQGVWGRLDVLHEFKGKNTVQYTPAAAGNETPVFTSTLHGTSLNLEGGVSLPVSDAASLYSSAGYRRGLGSNKGHGWKAEVGMRWVF